MMSDIQDSIINSILTIAGSRLKNVNFTKSFTGVVKNVDTTNLTCIVNVNGTEMECIVPHNLMNHVGKDDIVIVQDISNNNRQKIVQGVISSANQSMFQIYDPINDIVISSVEQLWDEETQTVVDVQLEIGD